MNAAPMAVPIRGAENALTLDGVKRTLRELIEENAGIPQAAIRDDSTIDGDLAMDSLSFVSLQVAVEETFDVTCDLDEIEKRNRFDAIAELVLELIEAQAAAR